MNSSMTQKNHRILVIDDNAAIHDDFRKILGAPDALDAELRAVEAKLFGTRSSVFYEIDAASQGQEGLTMVEKSLAAGKPYALAFVDVRMPPGWDGIETTRRIWEVCPDVQIVLCTAFADCSWSELQEQVNPLDRLLILKKPFDSIEVLQLANALTEKWRLRKASEIRLADLDAMVGQRTGELEESRTAALKMMQEAVANREQVEKAYEELKREEAERRKLEEQFREQASLLDKARDAILVRDLEHRITYWNKSAERLYGWTPDEAMGRHVRELLTIDPVKFQEAERTVYRKSAWRGEFETATKSGTVLTMDCSWTLVRDSQDNPKSILTIDTDITERKKLEQQFFRAQRLESIGTLAGGIAHDLNNVLSPIMMSIELLRMGEENPKRLQILATIGASAKRGAEMVKQVLSFARGVEGQRLPVQIKHLVRGIEQIANDTFPKNIQVRTVIPQNLRIVAGDSTQLHQVLLNLCVNARDAMPNGGTLTIVAENVKLDEQYAVLNIDAKPGRHVVVHVEDTGIGIPREIMEKIFDPFFTTKELDKGTGLGLSTSLAIIKSHGGFIRVTSEPGNGAKFSVYLPAQSEAAPDTQQTTAMDLPCGNGEVILVVDDEASVRQITRQTLETFGYRVVLAANGVEALATYVSQKETFAVVLTDMMMPVMDGAATIRALTAIDPHVRIVAASGHYSSGTPTDCGVKQFLTKPYTAEALIHAINEALR